MTLAVERSRSERPAAALTYARSAAAVASSASPISAAASCAAASGCSGAMTAYVAPISVSGRVVNTSIVCGALALAPSTSNVISAPSERPIHVFCIVMVPSGHSIPSVAKSAASCSAYSVMRRTHWRSGMRITGKPPRSDLPSMTSSLARTVPNSAHQFTRTSL